MAVVDVNYRPAGHPRRTGPAPTARSPWSAGAWCAWPAPPSTSAGAGPASLRRVETIVLVSEVTAPTLRAVQYACTVSPGAVRALHVEIEPEQRARVEAAWAQHGVKVPLEVVDSPYRDLTTTVLDHLDRAARRAGDEAMLNVVIPEFVVASTGGRLLHNQSALWIRAALYADTRIAVTSVPWVLEEAAEPAPAAAG